MSIECISIERRSGGCWHSSMRVAANTVVTVNFNPITGYSVNFPMGVRVQYTDYRQVNTFLTALDQAAQVDLAPEGATFH